MGSTSYLTT